METSPLALVVVQLAEVQTFRASRRRAKVFSASGFAASCSTMIGPNWLCSKLALLGLLLLPSSWVGKASLASLQNVPLLDDDELELGDAE